VEASGEGLREVSGPVAAGRGRQRPGAIVVVRGAAGHGIEGGSSGGGGVRGGQHRFA
jgi:hypothetical protein